MPRHRVCAVAAVGAGLLAIVGAYAAYSHIHSQGPPAEPTPGAGAPGATLMRLAALTRASAGVWEPASDIVSQQLLADMTPEVFASDPWTSPGVSMNDLL